MKLLENIPLASIFFGFSICIICIICNIILIKINDINKIGQDKLVGVQKFHTKSTSRLGGVSIGLGLFFAYFILKHLKPKEFQIELETYFFYFILAVLPVFIGGIAEDISHSTEPNIRLLMAIISPVLLYYFLQFYIKKTDVFIVDILLSIPGVNVGITFLVVAGFTHATNIVDGFNGLASGLIIMVLIGLIGLAWQLNDSILMQLCFLNLSALIGFFVLNWPFGKIFLGDGGAYLIGFWVVELGILLVFRNTKISPMAPVVLALIPLIETLFTIYRRSIIQKIPINRADALHLHTLIYRRIILNQNILNKIRNRELANALVIIVFLMPATILVFLTNLYYDKTLLLLLIIIVYVIFYVRLYKSIVNFKIQKWLF